MDIETNIKIFIYINLKKINKKAVNDYKIFKN